MAINNLLVNNESRVLKEVRSRVERSPHNLSQSRKFPCDVGLIYPFFCRKTLPSDSFKIWTNILIKQLQPLLVPQMVSFTVNTAFYWVDYSLAFPDFEYFLINQRGSRNIELPYVHLKTFNTTAGSNLPVLSLSFTDRVGKSEVPLFKNLRTFLDFTPNESNDKIDALPFWAYQTVIRDFYTNIDRLSESEYNKLFPSEASDHFLKPGANSFYNNNGISNFDEIGVHNVRGDYFVNSYPTPLRGDIPTLNISSEFSDLAGKFTSTIEASNFQPLTMNNKGIALGAGVGAEVDEGTFPINVKGPLSSDRGNLYYNNGITDSLLTAKINSNENNLWRAIDYNFNTLKAGLTYSGNINLRNLSSLQGAFSVTTRQLRLLESLTRKREIDILMKPRLKNYLQTYFDVQRYKDDSLYQPVFIGSTSQSILINDITQTASTDNSPLGRQGATAISLGSGYVGEYYCRNYGCLLGVMYILPDYDYEPALPKEWSERTPDDFVNPEFTHLSMQPILNKELYHSADESWNNQVLGYMGMYDNYRTSQNLVCGEFLNPNLTDIRQYAQVRRFDNRNKPEITTAFLDSNLAFDRSVFSTPTLPPFIAQCVARVEAVRPLPVLATPRS